MSTEQPDPIARYHDALRRAERSEPDVPNAATLATIDGRGRPSARVILIKGADARGFVFFTSYGSRKARELGEGAWAALCVHWKTLGEQFRVEGTVSRVSAEESDAYFKSRPFGSKIAATVSKQSEVLASREALEEAVAALRASYPNEEADVPRPDTWGGFRLSPNRIEVWKSRDDRLHDRELFEKTAHGWSKVLLYP